MTSARNRLTLVYAIAVCIAASFPLPASAGLRAAYHAFRQGKFAQAQAQLQKLRQEKREPTSVAWLTGHIAYAQKRYARAGHAYQKALLTCAPHHKPWLHNDIGNAYFHQKRWRRAIHHYAKALAQRPKYERARYNLELAVARLQQKQKKQQPPPPPRNRKPPPPPPPNKRKQRKKPPKMRNRGLKPNRSPPRVPRKRHFKLKPFDRFIPYSRILRHKKARKK